MPKYDGNKCLLSGPMDGSYKGQGRAVDWVFVKTNDFDFHALRAHNPATENSITDATSRSFGIGP
jgi:hypothetical protein